MVLQYRKGRWQDNLFGTPSPGSPSSPSLPIPAFCWSSHVISPLPWALNLLCLGKFPHSLKFWGRGRPDLPQAWKCHPAVCTGFSCVFLCLQWLLERLRLSEVLRAKEIRRPLSLSFILASVSQKSYMRSRARKGLQQGISTQGSAALVQGTAPSSPAVFPLSFTSPLSALVFLSLT